MPRLRSAATQASDRLALLVRCADTRQRSSASQGCPQARRSTTSDTPSRRRRFQPAKGFGIAHGASQQGHADRIVGANLIAEQLLWRHLMSQASAHQLQPHLAQ